LVVDVVQTGLEILVLQVVLAVVDLDLTLVWVRVVQEQLDRDSLVEQDFQPLTHLYLDQVVVQVALVA
jgi:hypothetical protein